MVVLIVKTEKLRPLNVINCSSSSNIYVTNGDLLDNIRKQSKKKTRLPASTRKELRVDFDKRQSGFSLTISKHSSR